MTVQQITNIKNALVGSNPEIAMLTPITRTDRPIEKIRFLNPPQTLSKIPPASIPPAKAISAMDAWVGVPRKYPMLIKGYNALIGIKKNIYAVPIQSNANKPLFFFNSKYPSFISRKKLFWLSPVHIGGFGIDRTATTLQARTAPIISNRIIVLNDQIIRPQNNYKTEVKAGHIITGENGIKKEYSLSLQEESLGTIQLFYFAPILKKTLETGKVLIIDELDKSLHPFIVKFLVNLFRNPDVNQNGAQLIFTTHDTTLLSLDVFRRDQIYFTEKDAQTGITDLYSLDDFAVRKDENIEKGYLLGRYGAIPYLHTEEIV